MQRSPRGEDGLPVVFDGEVIGGVGASFATPDEDQQSRKGGTRRARQ